jgi:hypothetical protein
MILLLQMVTMIFLFQIAPKYSSFKDYQDFFPP